MSSVLTNDQRKILLNVAAGCCEHAMPGLSDLQLLQRAGLIVKDSSKTRFLLTEAGKRYVSFIQKSASTWPSPQRPSEQPSFQKPGLL